MPTSIYILSFIYSTTCNYLDDMTHNPIYEIHGKRQFPRTNDVLLFRYYHTCLFPCFSKIYEIFVPCQPISFIG